MKVQRALISVFNKSGVESFAKGLTDLGVQVISTGGTARLLKDSGIPVTLVEEVTGFPEMLDGRVKTMHPRLMAGILANRDVPEHMDTIKEHGIEPVDMVVCSLYPFEEVAGRRGVTDEVVIENIDIGGPSMIRAAAKNHAGVAVVTSHEDYEPLLAELRDTGELSYPTLRELATKAFHRTAHYDFVIANWFSEDEGDFPSYVLRDYHKVLELKYGENPHQRAAYYAEVGLRQHLLSQVTQLHGKQLGFNNLYDLNAARAICDEFTLPCVVIIKHNNPCGVACADTIQQAYENAYFADRIAAMGGCIVLNRTLDVGCARAIADQYAEVVAAPEYEEGAVEILRARENLRIIRIPALAELEKIVGTPFLDIKSLVDGGLIIQASFRNRILTEDDFLPAEAIKDGTTYLARKPSRREAEDLLFAWAVEAGVTSNSIIFARDGATVSIGTGEQDRVGCVELTIQKAYTKYADRLAFERHNLSLYELKLKAKTDAELAASLEEILKKTDADRGGLPGTVLVSDGFFPFRDGVDLAVAQGVTAIAQPGGSIRDWEIIQAVNSATSQVAMVFTGQRSFKH
ncbi:MAG: bifunctional phosphoribosylaminoimidazolecarboxamide formyltransferase/IMP cyclohydrolase PurH [Deltaproteobacteria bacterium HGW-Deltaproteobacteria-20]|nr:MAG: bifunctional phosphoribosylaminoimidazolecarboxamide formyltransferase/IMP cyclohydrolase PurH [Deltaproteobacteria bacterium HGW-Deltaproteobacteria-20]